MDEIAEVLNRTSLLDPIYICPITVIICLVIIYAFGWRSTKFEEQMAEESGKRKRRRKAKNKIKENCGHLSETGSDATFTKQKPSKTNCTPEDDDSQTEVILPSSDGTFSDENANHVRQRTGLTNKTVEIQSKQEHKARRPTTSPRDSIGDHLLNHDSESEKEDYLSGESGDFKKSLMLAENCNASTADSGNTIGELDLNSEQNREGVDKTVRNQKKRKRGKLIKATDTTTVVEVKPQLEKQNKKPNEQIQNGRSEKMGPNDILGDDKENNPIEKKTQTMKKKCIARRDK